MDTYKFVFAKDIKVIVFDKSEVSALQNTINDWLLTIPKNSKIYEIKYVIADNSRDTGMPIYSALIIYEEGQKGGLKVKGVEL
jgi:hypothetical protein